MLKKLFTLGLFVFYINNLFAQLDPLFSQFYSNKLWNNPAYAGMEEKKVVGINYRNSWPQIGGYQTLVLSYDQNLEKYKSGIGGLLVYDHTQHSNSIQAGLVYNYRIKFSEKASLGIGTQLYLFYNRTGPLVIGDQLDARNRVVTSAQNISPYITTFRPDVDLGAWFQFHDFFAGISFKHIPAVWNSKYPLHYYAIAGNTLKFGKKFRITPSLIARFDDYSHLVTNPLIDINNTFTFFDLISVGGSYRLSHVQNVHKYIFNGGVTIAKKFEIMFSYDYPEIDVFGPSYEATLKAKF